MAWSKKFDPERIGIAKNAQRDPDRTALILGKKRVSYGQLDRDIDRLANVLLSLGMQRGDNIAALFHNGPEIFMVWAASAKIGITSLILNFKLKEYELAYILDDSQCKLLLYDQRFEKVVGGLKSKLMKADPVMVCAGAEPASDVYRLEDLMSQNPPVPPQMQDPSGMVPPTLAYTSGTTGRPKGVFRSGRKRLEYLILQAYLFGSGHEDVHLVAGPLYHAAPFGWGIFSLLLGNLVVIMSKFDAEGFLKLVSELHITTTFMVPTMMRRILSLPREALGQYDVSSLRAITVAGEPFPAAMKEKCIHFFGDGKLYEFYGGTETGVVTYLRPEDQLRKPGSCGKPLDGIEILVLDEEKREVPTGEVGVFYVKSPYLLDGYHNNPEATAANFLKGYFTVGDMGYVDHEGYYYLVDRAVDMIISGGVNIYPAEIEGVLYRHPDIQAAAVIGVPDSDWGEKVAAYVVPRPGSAPPAHDIIEYVGANLASYKKPKEVFFVSELPTSATGKILKRELRKAYMNQ